MRALLGFALFPGLIVFTLIVGLIGLSCTGDNPPEASFGSVVDINPEPGDISLGDPNALEQVPVQAFLFDPDGLPVNDTVVRFDLSFAGENSFIVDTDGDELPDARLLQLVDPHKCEEATGMLCENVPIEQWFALGAFVNSPFFTQTDDHGIARLIILISGSAVADPASLTATSGSAEPDVVEFSVNAE